MRNNIIAPTWKAEKFTCPHCNAVAGQLWGKLTAENGVDKRVSVQNYRILKLRGYDRWNDVICGYNEAWTVSLCENCHSICIWQNEKMIYPDVIIVDGPNEDLPDDIKKDYEEAALILGKSPRGAAALLRLCVQKLCIHLGKKGKNLNDDIGELVKEGLSPTIARAMDTLRITGSNAVHPGELDLKDDPEIARRLFGLINFIADKMITEPKEINSFYESIIPESAKNAVEKRSERK